MAPETKSKKRKAVQSDDEVEKVKKVKQMASEVLPKKRKSTDDAAPVVSKKSKAPKERVVEDSKPAPAKKSSLKKLKDLTDDVEESLAEKPKSSADVAKLEKKVKALKGSNTPASKTSKSIKGKDQKSVDADDEPLLNGATEEEAVEPSDDEDVDDQTEALLKGFESEEDEASGGEEFVSGKETLTLDKKTKKKLAKAASAASKQGSDDTPGVVYLGRIPHGFYENEMKQYFSQFGDISRIRLSRNRRTGQSKHFAFIEFKSAEVAEIVSKTMDNYLLFKHILKCKVVPREQVHEALFKGANKRFKKIPWNKMEGRKLEQGATEEQWERRIEREQDKRVKKAEKMKELGYEFTVPSLKSARDVPKQKRQPLVITTEADAADEELKAIEAPLEVSAPKKSVGKKQKNNTVVSDEPNAPEGAETLSSLPKAAKKASKATPESAASVDEEAIAQKQVAPDAAAKKSKKSKKSRVVS